MTIEELKMQLNAVFNTLDSVSVSGYQNLCKMQGAMAVIRSIVQSDVTTMEESKSEQ